MGPPIHCPRLSRRRKWMVSTISAYLVDMPSRAEAHIQNSAPGPPAERAAATPTMLPVPMVEARAVVSAWKGERESAVSSRLSRRRRVNSVFFSHQGRRRRGRKLVRRLSHRPHPSRATSMGVPHSRPLRVSSNSIFFSPSVLVGGVTLSYGGGEGKRICGCQAVVRLVQYTPGG